MCIRDRERRNGEWEGRVSSPPNLKPNFAHVYCVVLCRAVVTIGVVAVIAVAMSTLIVCVGVFCFRG